MTKPQKGTYGYLDKNKGNAWLKALAFLAAPLLVFAVGWAVNGTRMNVVTVFAIVGCLPGCNQVVHAIMASRYHSIDGRLYEEVEAARGERPALYENVLTSYENNFYVDCLIISGRDIVGFCSDEGADAAKAAEHIRRILKNNSYKQNVKIFNGKEKKAFLERVRTLAAQEPEAVPFKGDDRYEGMTRDEIIQYLLMAVSL